MANVALIAIPRSDAGIENPERQEIAFTGTVPATMRNAVEWLFFFNPRQRVLIQQIRTMVEATGVPSIIERDGRIWIGVPSGDMQCLFACDHSSKPIGVALYSRPAPDVLRVSHLAVDPECGCTDCGGSGLAACMVKKIVEIARSIKGITRVQLPYRRASFVRVRGQDRDQTAAPRGKLRRLLFSIPPIGGRPWPSC